MIILKNMSRLGYHSGLAKLCNRSSSVLRPKVVGTGSFHPRLITNEESFRLYQPVKADGDKVKTSWPEKYFGIKTKALGVNEEGNVEVTDTDLVVNSSQKAIENSGVSPGDIGCMIHVSPTPSYSHFQQHMPEMKERLGLSDDCNLVFLNLGCAGIASGLQIATGELMRMCNEKKVLLTTSQSIAETLNSRENAKKRYIDSVSESNPWIGLLLSLFGDGAGSMVLEGSYTSTGFRNIVNRCYSNMFVMDKKYGGGKNPILSDQDIVLDGFVSDPKAVAKYYTPTLVKVNEMLREKDEDIKYYLLHQSNMTLIKQASDLIRKSDTSSVNPQFPTNIETLGNTSTCSTLILLDNLMRDGKLNSGDLVRFLWIGGGNGCQYGGTTLEL